MRRHGVKDLTGRVVQHAREMAEELGVQAVIICADVLSSPGEMEPHLSGNPGLKTILATRDPKALGEALANSLEVLKVPNVNLTRMGQIKMAVLLGLCRGTLREGDRLICLSGIVGGGDLDTILFTRVGDESEIFATTGGEQIRQHSNPEVFERVLDIAVELGQAGREGKPVGTIFVIGDIERVKEFSEALMLNPFRGHPQEQRNILDPLLRGTIKELSALDGAFLIGDDGVVEAAGVFLRSVIAGSTLPQGMGARHRSAAAITAATKATAITVSESTGNVTVFREGKLIIEIEKPRAISSMAARSGDPLQKEAGVEAEG